MSTYSQMPIRLQADLVSSPPVIPVDANTGLPIKFWRAQAIAVQVGIFDAQGEAVDLSNVEYLQLIIQEAQDSLTPIVSKTVLAADINPVVSWANWEAGDNQQASFLLSSSETDLSLSGMGNAPYWLALLGHTTDGTDIIYAAGPITVYNPGSILPPPPTTTIVSAHEQTSAGATTVSVSPTAQIHFEEITVTGSAGTRNVVVATAGLIAGSRVSLRFILPATAGINMRIFDGSLAGTLLATIASTGDGFTPAARAEFWFDGTNLQRDFLFIPAFGQQT